MSYPWYDIIYGNELQQGDFIFSCPILLPPDNYDEDKEFTVDIEEIDVVILSQSCDLVNGKIDIVLVCPFMSLKEYLSALPVERTKSREAREKSIQELKKGILHGYHLLAKSEIGILPEDYLVVDFKNVYGIHFKALTKLAGKLNQRIRLLPPYREHLSQAFARYFMRVGLPQDIAIPKDYVK